MTLIGGELWLVIGPTCTFDVTVQVPAGSANGTYPNVTSTLTSSIGTANPAADALTIDSDLLQLTKEFTDDPVAPGGTANLRFTLTNLDDAQAASGIAFTDNLGAVLSGLSATGLPFAACGGTVSAIPDAGTIDFSGGSLGAGAQCQFDVSVAVPAAAAANPYTNTTSGLTGTIGGFAVSGDPASDDLLVLDLLQFSKSFDGPTTATGAAVMTFTVTNPGPNAAIGIAFTDDLDAMIAGAIATNLPLIDVCGLGSMITGTSFLALSGGGLPPNGGTCSFDVNILVPATATAGSFPNTTSELTQSGLPVALPAAANLVIEPPPSFAKAFAPTMIGQGLVSTLTFTIDNSASALAASSLNFTDNLPAGMVVATPSNATTTCTGGTLTAASGTGVISYTGGAAAAGAACTVQVDIVGTVTGAHVNTTGNLTSSSGNSGTAGDTLVVNARPASARSSRPT